MRPCRTPSGVVSSAKFWSRNHNVHPKAGERPFHFGVETRAACIWRGLRMNSACLNFVGNLVEVGHAETNQGNEWIVGGVFGGLTRLRSIGVVATAIGEFVVAIGILTSIRRYLPSFLVLAGA